MMGTYDDLDLASYGALMLRVGLGSMWIAHALLKWFVFTVPGFGAWLESQGLPVAMAWPVFLLELCGGAAILIGFYGRFVSLTLVPILIVATWTHLPNGWTHTSSGGGWEYPAFLVLASVTHALIGDGKWAIARYRPQSQKAVSSGF